jgi:hypothetical protein
VIRSAHPFEPAASYPILGSFSIRPFLPSVAA